MPSQECKLTQPHHTLKQKNTTYCVFIRLSHHIWKYANKWNCNILITKLYISGLKTLEEPELTNLIEKMRKKKYIVVDKESVSYRPPISNQLP
jgi:hypothetical protein